MALHRLEQRQSLLRDVVTRCGELLRSLGVRADVASVNAAHEVKDPADSYDQRSEAPADAHEVSHDHHNAQDGTRSHINI